MLQKCQSHKRQRKAVKMFQIKEGQLNATPAPSRDPLLEGDVLSKEHQEADGQNWNTNGRLVN